MGSGGIARSSENRGGSGMEGKRAFPAASAGNEGTRRSCVALAARDRGSSEVVRDGRSPGVSGIATYPLEEGFSVVTIELRGDRGSRSFEPSVTCCY